MKGKSLSLALILTVCALVPISPAVAKVGASCTKAGAKKVEGGLNLLCVKQGKKLKWAKVKSQALPKPTPTTSPSPVATTNASEAPQVEAQSKYPASPTSFEDLWEKRDGIIYGTWSKVISELNKNKPSLPPFEIYRGANTPTYISEENLKKALSDVSQLYANYQMPKKVILFYYSRADLESMTKVAQDVMGPEFQKAYDAHGGPLVKCNVPGDCDDGDAYVGADGTAYMAVGLSIKPSPQMKGRYDVANAETTEFYHSIQGYFYYLNKSSVKSVNGLASPNKPPHWLSSSSENITSEVLAARNDFERYRLSQQGYKGWAKSIGLDVTPEWVDSYVDIKNLNNMWSNNRFNGPGRNSMLMGGMINNILISIAGPSVMLDFHKEMSAGITFEEAFARKFGVSWVSVSPLISKVVYDFFQKTY